MHKSMTLTQLELHNLLSYNPETGDFRWLVSRYGIKRNGIAGCSDPAGYLQIRIDGQKYYGHRLAWLWMTGKWPADEIDHCDLNPHNNCWNNLRLATKSQNNANRLPLSNNTSGFKGVSWNTEKKKWRARIMFNRKEHHLGYFLTANEAYAVYCAAAKKFFGRFARE